MHVNRNHNCYFQRKFIRDRPTAREANNFFSDFGEWVASKYSSTDQVDWSNILEEYSAHSYGPAASDENGSSELPEPLSEDDIMSEISS